MGNINKNKFCIKLVDINFDEMSNYESGIRPNDNVVSTQNLFFDA